MENFEYENDLYEERPTDQEPPQRSAGLLILCILTFIYSGLNAFSYLVMPMVGNMLPALEQSYAQMGMQSLYEQSAPLFEFYASVPSWKFILTALTFALAVMGAALMLKMKSLGFHLYVIAQILGFVCLHFLIGGPARMNIISIVWTILFILLYYLQMRPVLKINRK